MELEPPAVQDPRRSPARSSAALALAFVAALSPAAVPAATLATTHVVAKGGDESPDATGTFFPLTVPVLGASGQAAFGANIYDDHGFLVGDGLLRASAPADLVLIARAYQLGHNPSGWPAPDGNGYLSPLSTPATAINESGQVAFYSRLTQTFAPTEAEGFFVGTGGQVGLVQIARPNDAVPNTTDVISDLSTPSSILCLNDAGLLAFVAGVSGANQALAILTGDDTAGSLVEVVRGGQATPDNTATFLEFIAPTPINQSGQVAFSALSVPSGGGIFRAGGGPLTKIAQTGDASPDGNGIFLALGTVAPAFNDAGQAAFFANLSGTTGGSSDNAGIFRGDGSSLAVIARRGDLTPGGNGRLLDIFSVAFAFNDLGQVLFESTITGAQNGSAAGIFRGDGGALTPIARINDLAPGGGVFSKFETTTLALNGHGQAVFQAFIDLGDGRSTQDTEGLFLYDDVRGLVAVARLGDAVPGASTVGQINFAGATFRGPGTSGLNDKGQVAYLMGGDDGIPYVVVAPEPGGGALALAAVAALLVRRSSALRSSSSSSVRGQSPRRRRESARSASSFPSV